MIRAEQKQKAIQFYRNKSLTIAEIANLTNISEPYLKTILRQAFELGTIKPRNSDRALKPRTPNGLGKPRYVPTGKKRGNPNPNRKYNYEQEQQIAEDYYQNGLTLSGLKEKWNIHPMQLQRIRDKYSNLYGKKVSPTIKAVQQFDKDGTLIADFESGHKASVETGICYNNINACCNGRTRFAGGFVWKFKTNNN